MEATVRPARSSDKAPLMSFIKDVWGGHDYIPMVWDQWLKDRRGKIFVVEADGRPVGMNRVRFQDDGSAWFEGARVRPEFRGRGFASMLGDKSMEFAKSRGVEVFRLTSGSHNSAAHRQIARIRFKEVSRFSVYEPTGNSSPIATEDVRKMRKRELPDLIRLIRSAREFRLGSGVFWHDFTAAALTPDVVGGLVEEGAIWRAGHAVAVAQQGGEGSEIWEEICFLGGPISDALKLVRFLVGRDAKASERWVFVPRKSPIIHALRKEGYERNFSMILFERHGANG